MAVAAALPLEDAVRREQAQDAVFGLRAAFVVVKMECVDAGLQLKTRALEAALDGTAVARFQLQIGEQFESGRDAEISGCCVSDGRLGLAAHRFHVELLKFLFERSNRIPFRIQE